MTGPAPSRDDERDDASDDRTASRVDAPRRLCANCCTPFIPSGRQAYCASACRQQAYRRRSSANEVLAHTPAPPQRGRGEVTVYQCADCDQAYLGLQWCPDCQRPCQRLGFGGNCPHCSEPVSIDQLLTSTP